MEQKEKFQQSFTKYVLGAQSMDLCKTYTSPITWDMNLALYQELLHPYKQTFYRTVTEHHRQWANIFKFRQVLVPGDNCLLWHDLCNTFHLVILESKEFYQSSHSDKQEWFVP